MKIAASTGGDGILLLFFILGSLSLIGLKAASNNNMLQSIANSIGWYCLGKGIFMIAAPVHARGAFLKLIGRK